MSSATTPYGDHAADLYYEIYGTEMERQSDVYTQNNMELFEKVWVAAREEQKEDDRIAADRSGGGVMIENRYQDINSQGFGAVGAMEQVDDSTTNIPNDWPEILNEDPSSMLWTCNVCQAQMNVIFRTEHMAKGHPQKERKLPGSTKRKAKAEASGSMPTWRCGLCDEEVSMFYTTEHVAGKKHVMKLKESGEYQYILPSEEFVEQRAVYKPQDGEDVLERAEEEEAWDAGGSSGYIEEESGVYRPPEVASVSEGWGPDEKPPEVESVSEGWGPDEKPAGGENLKGGGLYQPEGKDDDWEIQDKTIYRPFAEDDLGPEESSLETGMPEASASTQHKEQQTLPMSSPKQQYLPNQSQPGLSSSHKFLSSYYNQAPVHIQVETFYCELCDTEYPTSERRLHSDQTFECTICDDEYHLSARSEHLASREHQTCAKAAGEMPQVHTPKAPLSQAWVPKVVPMPEVAVPKAPAPKAEAAQKPAAPPHWRCEVCQRTMDVNSRNSHLAGIRHHNKQKSILEAQAAKKAQESRKAQETQNTPASQGSQAPQEPATHRPYTRGFANTFTRNMANSSSPSGPGSSDTASPKKLYCSVCIMMIDADSRADHVLTLRHKELHAIRMGMESNTQISRISRPAYSSPGAFVPQSGVSGLADSTVPKVKKEMFNCNLCNMTMAIGARESHLNGLRHKANESVRKAEAAARYEESKAVPAGIKEIGPDKVLCKPCGIKMGADSLRSHLNGKKHIKKMGEIAANTSDAGSTGPGESSSGPSASNSGPRRTPSRASAASAPPTQFHCLLCKMTLGITCKEVHLGGKKHKKKELAYYTERGTVPPADSSQIFTKNVVTEMDIMKVNGEFVIKTKVEPDLHWCPTCQMHITGQPRVDHQSAAWKCTVCGTKIHLA